MSLRRFPIWLIMLLAAALVGGAAGGASYYAGAGGRVPPGVRLAGQPVSGLDHRQVELVVARLATESFNRPIILQAPDRTWSLSPERLGYRVDVRRTVAQLWPRHRGIWPISLFSARAEKARGGGIPFAVSGDGTLLATLLRGMAADLYRPPRNARFDLATGRIIPGQSGQVLDVAATTRQVNLAIAGLGERHIQLVLRSVSPATGVRQLEKAGARVVLASYLTRFDTSDVSRVHNLRLAAASLDGAVVLPGKTFSFNATVGPRVPEAGYQPAPEIVQEKYVVGIGGGTCQVSSTLYNAALLAGLQVTERTAHSQPLGYVTLGRDATVYYGLIDLKFRNNRAHPVVIATEVNAGTLTVALCGQPEDFPEVRVVVGPVEPLEPGPDEVVQDDSLPPGTRQVVAESRPGYKVSVFRQYYRNDRLVGQEQVSSDVYPPQPREVKTGPEPSPGAGQVDLSKPVLYNELN